MQQPFWGCVQRHMDNGHTGSGHGPAARFVWACAQMGWHIHPNTESVSFTHCVEQTLNMHEVDEETLAHLARESLRREQWRKVAARRPGDFGGLDAPQGVDRESTLAYLNKCSAHEKRTIRTVLMGGIETRQRRHRRRVAIHDKCFFCWNPHPVETTEHILHECSGLRSDRGDLWPNFCTPDLPACTLNCSIVMEDPRIIEAERLLQAAAEMPGEPIQPQPGDTIYQDRVVVFTDGACKRPRHEKIRRAGSGVFYGPDNRSNIARPLPGPAQTNQRAELWAVVLVLENDARRVEIRSDSKYVVNGLRSWPTWRQLGWQGSNRDLWLRVHRCLSAAPDRCLITKVKGHARWSEVRTGSVTMEDKVGNDGADHLAGQGADEHMALIGLESELHERRNKAKGRQKRMAHILHVRDRDLALLPWSVVGPPVGHFARSLNRRFVVPDPP